MASSKSRPSKSIMSMYSWRTFRQKPSLYSFSLPRKSPITVLSSSPGLQYWCRNLATSRGVCSKWPHVSRYLRPCMGLWLNWRMPRARSSAKRCLRSKRSITSFPAFIAASAAAATAAARSSFSAAVVASSASRAAFSSSLSGSSGGPSAQNTSESSTALRPCSPISRRVASCSCILREPPNASSSAGLTLPLAVFARASTMWRNRSIESKSAS
mmetsp:Transcript_51306/g.143595  ORF Transcript_51306/g.143595 Transcript_51306/m.143595 type:complete len:214 (-) Transcript_51306:786-1427(-)